MKTRKFDLADKKEQIRQSLSSIAKKLGKTPTQKEYKQQQENQISLEQITYLYGNWSAALLDAGLTPNPFQSPPRAPEITEKQLIDEFIRVANLLGSLPGMNQFRANSKYSWRPYTIKWGSWGSVKQYIVNEYSQYFQFRAEIPNIKQSKVATRKRLRFSCPLIYEPTNEFETIVLFAYLAKNLGFEIKSIKASFPDALVIKDGVETPVEFEFLSSNYLQHGHPLNPNCLCICWRKDIELENMNVLSLEEYLRDRKDET